MVVAALLPLVLDVGRSFLMSQICIYGVIALSLTVLTGWAGQVSLGQFALVGGGGGHGRALRRPASRSSSSSPWPGSSPRLVSVLVGLTALRIRGLYLAVSTLGFALFMQTSVLATSCWTVPLIHRTICSGLPDPQSTLISPAHAVRARAVPRNGPSPGSPWACSSCRSSWCGCGATGASPGGSSRCATTRWRRARRASRWCAPSSWRSRCRASWPGYAGVCLAFATERFSTDTFDPTVSILVVSMVVIGGLDAIPGAVLGALYLVGLPAIFGSSTTVEFLTSGMGLMAFILYLPGGMAQVHAPAAATSPPPVSSNSAPAGDGEPPSSRPPPTGRRRQPATESTPTGAVAEVTVTAPRTADDPPSPTTTRTTRRGPSPPGAEEGTGAPRDHRPGRVVRRAAGRRRGQPVGRAGRDRRAHRAQRVGQDHAARHGLRARVAGARAR